MGSVSEATQNRSIRSATESESTPRIATGLDFLGLGISSPEVDSTVSTLCREMVVTMYRKATHDSQHCLCRGPRLLGPQSPNKSRRPSGGSRLSPAEQLALVRCTVSSAMPRRYSSVSSSLSHFPTSAPLTVRSHIFNQA